MPDLLNTREGGDGPRLERAFRALAPGGWRAVPCPLIGFRPTGGVLVPEGAVPVFTSAKGVRSVPGGAGPAWGVGPHTAEVARAAGWDAREGEGDAASLVAAILRAPPVPGPFLHVRGRHARAEVAALLRGGGREASEVVAYDQPLLEPPEEARRALRGAAPLVVPLLSPRAAAHFAALAGNACAPLHIVALSRAVAEAWGRPVAAVADRPELASLAEAAAPLLVGGAGGR
ncbi:uroporphyrinogen-III synthase [Hasllibacter halocynthiae]|uniref:Uroporphyrinogen-III synthase n=1 Tax=Hasllibacter halocynthiae TaxID=595589 RepID=A0A2T0X2K2_9RHOB|nr:uroporphyrinogen-III synthase [Hasllibacter halocynthiae]PRY93183.1 uroporphyrinogen-III synthase [Hasllibacter halocynthiae]